MWTALAITAALSSAAAQTGDFALSNVRPTLGLFGPPRKDADAPKVPAGDVLFFSFDIDNLKVLEDGRVRYGVGMVWTDKEGKVVYSEEPLPLEMIPVLGGARVPALSARARTSILLLGSTRSPSSSWTAPPSSRKK